jgi:hypothetical protein
LRSTTFILAVSPSDVVLVWNYKKDKNFLNNVTITLSDEEMTKIKVVDLDKFYNFYVYDFFSWNNLVFQNDIWSCHFLKFKIQIDKTQSLEKMDKIIAEIT